MSIEFYRGSPGKFDSRTLRRETLSRWTGRKAEFDATVISQTKHIYIYIYIHIYIYIYEKSIILVQRLAVRPVHLLRVFLLRVLESNFPGDSL